MWYFLDYRLGTLVEELELELFVIVIPSIDWWLEYLLRPDVMICHGVVDIMTRETAGVWWLDQIGTKLSCSGRMWSLLETRRS